MEENNPKISIIMPFYNAEKFLDDSVSSILNQTFSNFELIVINDASTDDSDRVIQKYLNDSRIIYIKNSVNSGIVTNLNSGLNIAKAEIIARMDGDDISAYNRIEQQYNYLLSHDEIDLIGCFVETIDELGNHLSKMEKPTNHEEIKKVCFFYAPFVHPAIMFRKKILNTTGVYNEQYPYGQDIDFFYRVIFSGFKTANIPEYLLKYRKHSDSTDKRIKQRAKISLVIKKAVIKDFNLKLNFTESLSIYIHYFLDMTLTAKQKQKIEYLLKNYLSFLWKKTI